MNNLLLLPNKQTTNITFPSISAERLALLAVVVRLSLCRVHPFLNHSIFLRVRRYGALPVPCVLGQVSGPVC